MSQNIWTQCEGKFKIRPRRLTAWRLVEDQYQNQTRDLVDSLEEQELLETLLEAAKPPAPALEKAKPFHFLLWTPFRYYPLRPGSRFGTRGEKGIWYWSLEPSVALTEMAFLRLRFLNDTNAPLVLQTQFTVFPATIVSNYVIDLTQKPFLSCRNQISHRLTYRYSQLLGASMRKAYVECCLYFSVRCKDGINAAVFSLRALAQASLNESKFQRWHCYGTKDKLEFHRSSLIKTEHLVFERAQFEIRGVFPLMEN